MHTSPDEQSKSRVDNYRSVNAQQESLWSTLKTEFYDRHIFTTRTETITAVTGWIETVYSRRRRHSALGQIPPVLFEDRLTTTTLQAA